MEQLSLFQSVIEEQQTKFQLMDRVKVILIDEAIDSEAHHYRKFYEPFVIHKVGEITNICINKKHGVTYEVDIYGIKYLFLEEELVWIG
ncbi:hypothetical protein [Solibacillus sp. FSL H8-0538]|uniref:hypothetical protein n=1 Tax=Solibacillus sp. FSL H8-0538 TaxID=2921400 RepID=UPI0030F686D9